jgi:hypothetical protein
MRDRRRKIWIDRFQTYLALRIAFFFVFYQVGGWSLILFERQITDGLSRAVGPAPTTPWLLLLIGAVVALACLSIYDSVKFIHRLVGPVYRFRKAIQAITAGNEVELVTLRKGDFLQDMKDEFNEMLKALEQRGAVNLRTTKAKTEQGQPLSV